MGEYLKPTELCDSEDETIGRKARELAGDASTPREAALGIFGFVRDQIPFALGKVGSASATLRHGTGYCVTKTYLQVALLRAAGVPARYHQAVLAKDVLKGIIPGWVHRMAPEKVWFHPWCECYLSGEWVPCETLFDKALYNAALTKGILSEEQIPAVDWDGCSSLCVVTAWLLEDVGTFHSMDDVFRRAQSEQAPGPIGPIMLYFCNRYTDRVRRG
jgi:hypothetical protein